MFTLYDFQNDILRVCSLGIWMFISLKMVEFCFWCAIATWKGRIGSNCRGFTSISIIYIPMLSHDLSFQAGKQQ